MFVAAYASQTQRDPLTERLMEGVERWHWVHGRDDVQLAALWARVLAAVPGSVLLLKWRGMQDPIVQARLRSMFSAQGVVGEQLRFSGMSGHDAMLDEYGTVDVALDPFPFSGALTTCEALWMGVPVVTLPGVRPVSRQSHAILQCIGKGAWSCASAEDYVAAAAQLAADRAGRENLRHGLRAAMAGSALCDHRGFAAALEAANRTLWARVAG